jgi:hypothetical protein
MEQASTHPTAKAIGHRSSLASFMRRAIKQAPNSRKRFIALLIPLLQVLPLSGTALR